MTRPDANRITLRALRAVLDGAHDFEFKVDGPVKARVSYAPESPWPRTIAGLDAALDAPWPRSVKVDFSWEGGSTALVMLVVPWSGSSAYPDGLGVRVELAKPSRREVLWITVVQSVAEAADGAACPVQGWASLMKRKDEEWNTGGGRYVGRLQHLVDDAGLVRSSNARVELFQIRVPDGAVEPSPEAAFERLAILAFVKLPFQLRGGLPGIVGVPPFPIEPEPTDVPDDEMATARHAAIWPLPGGVRRYKETLELLLGWLVDAPMEVEAFEQRLATHFGIQGETAVRGYRNVLTALGAVQRREGILELTEAGVGYLADPTPAHLFRMLQAAFSGVLETLVIAERRKSGALTRSSDDLLVRVLGVTWKSANQPMFRRNWLLSLGFVDRTKTGDVISDLGRSALAEYEDEAAEIRAALDEILQEPPDEDPPELPPDDPPGNDGAPKSAPEGVPAAWFDTTLDLTSEMVTPYLEGLELPPQTLAQAAAALSSGKHLLLVGPPGTGKTELAFALARAAQEEGYCYGLFPATASADWTTYETVGGYALDHEGHMHFRPGAFLRAIEGHQWLLIDELNRADVDRAFGELMTVLSGKGVRTSFVRNDEVVSIGPGGDYTHQVPRTFRVIATMNTWDKTSLFRLSFAVQRRFAIVHVGIPEAATYSALISLNGTGDRPEADAPLAADEVARISELFGADGILRFKPIGPAVAIDVVRYVRRRQAKGDGLAEAIALFVLPQLEGLELDPAKGAWSTLARSLDDWTSTEAKGELAQRFKELFPHVPMSAK